MDTDELPKNVEEYSCLGAEKLARFLVGKTLELRDPVLKEIDGAGVVTGIVHQHENAVEDEQMPASPSDWQVSVMSSKPLREYTYAVADFMKTDGARYLDLPKGSPPTVTMTIKDTEDKREEGKNLHKEQHFMGGCATGQDMISSKGLSKMKGKSIAVWWPGERAWFPARISATKSPITLVIEYFDETPNETKQYFEFVWRLEETEDTFENGKAAQAKRCEIIATNAKRTGSKSGEAAGNGKKRKAPGKIEYNDQEESVLMDDGNVTLKVNSENMMRLVDKSLPLMKRRSKYCSVTTPSSECAIFTIQESTKKPAKHIVNVVLTKNSLRSADMSLEDERWNLDWAMESKQS